MSNKEIKRRAIAVIKGNVAPAAVSILSIMLVFVLIVLIESFTYIIARLSGINYQPFEISFYRNSHAALIFLAVRILLYYIAFAAASYVARRTFINFTDSNEGTERFSASHLRKTMLPAVKCSLCLTGLKLLVLSPISVGLYGMYYFVMQSRVGDITIFGMVLFMLSLGFSIVWFCVCLHYYVSLSMVNYIVALNPRTNFFDACDLSVKLMEGCFFRILSFCISMLPYLASLVFVYPILIVAPCSMECRLILAKDIMGDYWQDKLPAMARRWEKQQARLSDSSDFVDAISIG